ncbi:aspartic and glutamic acid-rich protein-like isoform X3 [Palaemon carinicauda]|uniref:aspartic and glutamic acid-rich protein-like isoform X3 n=1 Tax=Palaemon carinicauda TaxID=392227 RepID=UPI0035B5A3E0
MIIILKKAPMWRMPIITKMIPTTIPMMMTIIPRDKSHEDDATSHEDDPNYHPDDDDDHPDDDDDHPDDDDDHPEDKSHEDDAKSHEDDPDYHPDDDDDDDHPDDDDDHAEHNSHENYEDDPNYYPDEDEDNFEDSHEDHARSVELRQIKGGHIQQQNGYVKYDVEGVGYNPWQPEINQLDDEISFGVEPLPPVQASDVAHGVEAVDGESEDDDSYRTWFYNKFANVGDALEDSLDTIRDKVSGAVDTIQDVAEDAADKIHDAAHSTGSTIVDAYHSLKDRFSELRQKIHHLFSSFGLMVQRGADYCIQHLQHTANQVREAQILDKLQQKLKDGNEHVTAFFTILGEKITSWAQSHGHDNVDQGLILVESHGDQTADEGSGDRENVFPNLFQDQEVLDQMNQMVNQGVITQEELDLLYQQTEQVSGHQYNQGAIIESHSRRRNLRSRVTVV